jgi:hypothetical protein
MRKLVFALTAAAAVAFAAPNVSFARDNRGGHGGGGGSHASGGGHSGGGGRSFSGGGGRSMGGARSMNVQRGHSMNMQRSMSSRNFNRHVSNRDVQWNRHAGRHVNSRNFAAADTRSLRRDRVASNDRRHDRHHRHHRHHRNFVYFDTPDFYYDDYASNGCYQYVWTRYGYRNVNTCATDYYSIY